jgi:hypothetical protein
MELDEVMEKISQMDKRLTRLENQTTKKEPIRYVI